MSGPKDGGPAFPRPGTAHGGMSLRDWFAGMAMAGTVNFPQAPTFKKAAEHAYEMADAMLAAREVKP